MLTEGLQQVLTVLYPLYKDEVYKRREQMMRLTALGSLGLIAMLFALLLSPQKHRLSTPEAFLMGIVGLIWCGLFCALVLQQQYRHRLAKQVLIRIEQALGFYEEGLFVENQALYPDGWKIAWLGDRSGTFYLSVLCLLTLIFLLALLLD
ncbi:MAG: hypothetical protein GDA67_00605 [Nitrospira sp. CR1.3]|nr:hypothetical protein [Nitrospira sp. CR1.3]